jgi:hypothetical protein
VASEHVELCFPGVPLGEANLLATSLADELREEQVGVEVTQARSDASTMDLGSTLLLALGPGSAVTTLAAGVASWVARHRGVKLQVRRGEDVLIVENADATTATQLMRMFRED